MAALFTNPTPRNVERPAAAILESLGARGRCAVERFLDHGPAHRPTPLLRLTALARTIGVGEVAIKDEGQRLGLKSFKALGGSYAVMRLMIERAEAELGSSIDPSQLASDPVRAIAARMTVTCATDGNHGRSVAAGARLVGCRSVIFVHAGVSHARAAAIAAFGAEIVRAGDTYDESVAAAAEAAAREGWIVVSDTSWEGYERIPLMIMQGYTVMAGEAFDAMTSPPSHIFVQAGVGGMAAAVAAHAHEVLGAAMPKLVVVEPERAACLFASATAGRRVAIPRGASTVMAMLECFEPSHIAWSILGPLADAFMTLPDEAAVDAMRRLADPSGDDPAIVAGESGGVGLAALLRATRDPQMRGALELDATSRVLLFNTEGATDPARYKDLVGREPP